MRPTAYAQRDGATGQTLRGVAPGVDAAPAASDDDAAAYGTGAAAAAGDEDAAFARLAAETIVALSYEVSQNREAHTPFKLHAQSCVRSGALLL